jgi:ATP synthase protein I
MTNGDEKETNGAMNEAVRLREQRRERWLQSGERPLWRNLSMIGALGWLIVTPTLLGTLIGRWLDLRFGTGILWSGALIILGVTLGGYLAWQRIGKE